MLSQAESSRRDQFEFNNKESVSTFLYEFNLSSSTISINGMHVVEQWMTHLTLTYKNNHSLHYIQLGLENILWRCSLVDNNDLSKFAVGFSSDYDKWNFVCPKISFLLQFSFKFMERIGIWVWWKWFWFILLELSVRVLHNVVIISSWLIKCRILSNLFIL